MILIKNLFLLFLLLNLSLLANAKDYELLDRVIIRVEKEVVTQKEVEKEIKKIVDATNSNKIDNEQYNQIKNEVTKNLIEKKLIMQHANQSNVVISEQEIDFVINNILTNNDISIEILEEDLKKNNSNLIQFKNDLKFQLIVQKIKDREISPLINVSEYEITAWLKSEVKTSVEYKVFHSLVKHNRPDQEAVVKKIIDGGKDNFKKLTEKYSDGPNAQIFGDLGWLKIENIPTIFQDFILTSKPGDISNPIKSSNGLHILYLENIKTNKNTKPVVIKQYKFQQVLLKFNALNSDEEFKKKLNLLKAEIEDGLNFSDAVKLYSDDQFNNDPEKLNWINFNNLLPEFKKNIDFAKVNSVLGPFKTELGWHLVKIYDFRESDVTDQSEREKAKIEIIKTKAESKFKDWLHNLYKNSKITYLENN